MKEIIPLAQRFRCWCNKYYARSFNGRQFSPILGLVVLALLIMGSLAWVDPVTSRSGAPLGSGGGAAIVKATSTSVPVGNQETATPFPPEFLNNLQQTDGVIFIGVLIVVIIVAGTIGTNRSRRME